MLRPIRRAQLHSVLLVLVVVLVPVFWFPWQSPLLTLAVLPLIPLAWAARWLGRDDLLDQRAVEWPLALLLFSACIASTPVADWRVGLPKQLGVALGVFTLVTVARLVDSAMKVRLSIATAGAVAMLLVVVGAIAGDWSATALKVPVVRPLMTGTVLRGPLAVPGTAGGAINANELAGALVLVAPLLLTYALGTTQSYKLGAGHAWAWFTGSAAMAMIFLTQSRSGLMAAGACLVALGGVAVYRLLVTSGRSSALRLIVAGGYVASVAIGIGWAMFLVVRWVGPVQSAGVLQSFAGRAEIWQRAAYMLQDFPVTGIGLGQFNSVLHTLYPPLLVPPTQFVAHAHNMVLEYAVELGIPGAIAFVGLIAVFYRQCLRAVASADPSVRWTGAGAGLSITAFLIYGLTDTIAPGARAGLLQWLVLGIGVGAGTVAEAKPRVIR